MSYFAAADSVRSHPRSFAAGLVLDETDKRKGLQKGHSIADLLCRFSLSPWVLNKPGVLNPAIPSNREGLIMATFLVWFAILGKVLVPCLCNRLAMVWEDSTRRGDWSLSVLALRLEFSRNPWKHYVGHCDDLLLLVWFRFSEAAPLRS